MTPDITLVITPALTKARIIRRMASTLGEPIDENLAQELAFDLHELVADFRQAYRAQPGGGPAWTATVEAIEEADMHRGARPRDRRRARLPGGARPIGAPIV